MGSFTSTAKIENSDSADEDLCETFHPTTVPELLKRCRKEIESAGHPPILNRHFRILDGTLPNKRSFLRVLQWNVLSQSKSQKLPIFY